MSTGHLVHDALRRLVLHCARLALPSRCVACPAELDALRGPTCRACAERLAREAGADRCVECSARVEDGTGRCGPCARPRRVRVVSPRGHRGVARALVHALKYRRRRDAGDVLAAVTASDARVRAELEATDVVVPVPADPVRRRERGFNTARLLAEGLVEECGKAPVRDVLALRRGRPQVGRGGAQRRVAPRGTMRARWHARWCVRGRSVLLVDDVATTGATLHEAARVLRRAGARRLVAVTVTRAEGPLVGEGRARREAGAP